MQGESRSLKSPRKNTLFSFFSGNIPRGFNGNRGILRPNFRAVVEQPGKTVGEIDLCNRISAISAAGIKTPWARGVCKWAKHQISTGLRFLFVGDIDGGGEIGDICIVG